MLFIRGPVKTSISPDNAVEDLVFSTNTDKQETLNWVIQSYSHLLPKGRFLSAEQFAEIIKQNYSIEEPHNKEAVDFLLTIGGLAA